MQVAGNDLDKIDNAIRGWIARLRAAGLTMANRGSPIGRYFISVDEGAIASQRDTKDHLSDRLRASSDTPQIVTVQARGGEKGRAYMIIPLDKATETLEAGVYDADDFVPITMRLREIGGDVDLPMLKPRVTGRRRRSARAAVPAIASTSSDA